MDLFQISSIISDRYTAQLDNLKNEIQQRWHVWGYRWSIPRHNSLSMHIFVTLDLIIKVPTAPWFFPGRCVVHKFEMQIHGPVQWLRLPHGNIYETVYFQDCFFFWKSLASHWATPTIGRLISTCEVFFIDKLVKLWYQVYKVDDIRYPTWGKGRREGILVDVVHLQTLVSFRWLFFLTYFFAAIYDLNK